MLYSPIDPDSPRGEFPRQVALIIWDEAGMANWAAFECVDDVCRRVMKINKLFSGKTVVLLGDFRQTCPVIRCGSRLQVVDACIQRSILWPNFVIRRLNQPIRSVNFVCICVSPYHPWSPARVFKTRSLGQRMYKLTCTTKKSLLVLRVLPVPTSLPIL